MAENRNEKTEKVSSKLKGVILFRPIYPQLRNKGTLEDVTFLPLEVIGYQLDEEYGRMHSRGLTIHLKEVEVGEEVYLPSRDWAWFDPRTREFTIRMLNYPEVGWPDLLEKLDVDVNNPVDLNGKRVYGVLYEYSDSEVRKTSDGELITVSPPGKYFMGITTEKPKE